MMVAQLSGDVTMGSPYHPRVKICCIQSIEEADLAIRYGASAIGLVSDMPSGPGPIPETSIAEIASAVPPGVATFLLTCREDAGAIIDQQRECRANTIQIVDRLRSGSYDDIRAALPGVSLVQVIHVRGPEALEEAAEAAARGASGLLLDSGNPSLPKRELGGTGRTHDWLLSERIVAESPLPVFLAGGLTAGNVYAAIERVRPYGVDVCSGVRTEGRLDEGKLAAFVGAVAEAGRRLPCR
jgi:phosphoribosylanthranilate isomerase